MPGVILMLNIVVIGSQVIEYDCLLLEHVFGQRPDDAQKVKQFVLDTIASDPGLQQTELVFLGLFGRACRVLENRNKEVTASHRKGFYISVCYFVLL